MKSHADRCDCDECWLARRVEVLKFRALPDDRYIRSAETHSAYAWRSGRCRCDICKEAALVTRRKYRK